MFLPHAEPTVHIVLYNIIHITTIYAWQQIRLYASTYMLLTHTEQTINNDDWLFFFIFFATLSISNSKSCELVMFPLTFWGRLTWQGSSVCCRQIGWPIWTDRSAEENNWLLDAPGGRRRHRKEELGQKKYFQQDIDVMSRASVNGRWVVAVVVNHRAST